MYVTLDNGQGLNFICHNNNIIYAVLSFISDFSQQISVDGYRIYCY